jgi:hypothetical protein
MEVYLLTLDKNRPVMKLVRALLYRPGPAGAAWSGVPDNLLRLYPA